MKNNLFKYIPLLTFTVLTMLIVLLSPLFQINLSQPGYFRQDFVNAVILDVISEELEEDELFPGRYGGSQVVLVGILEGPHTHEAYEINNPLSNSHYVYVQEGDRVIASVDDKADGSTTVWLYNYKRDTALYGLAALFLVLLLLLGRRKGFYSILSLIFTGVVILFFIVPLIFTGLHPAPVTMMGVAMIAVVSFMLIGGMTRKTLIVIIGTLAGVISAGVVSYIFGRITMLTGINMDQGQEVVFVIKDYRVQASGLMFSAILIASLGAVMDVTMSVVSSMQEVYDIHPRISVRELFDSGMNVGRDVMGTMSNTLILAFTGSSLNSILLIWGYRMEVTQFMNIPFLAVEIVQGLAGSIGIILTVPISAFAAAFIYKRS